VGRDRVSRFLWKMALFPEVGAASFSSPPAGTEVSVSSSQDGGGSPSEEGLRKGPSSCGILTYRASFFFR